MYVLRISRNEFASHQGGKQLAWQWNKVLCTDYSVLLKGDIASSGRSQSVNRGGEGQSDKWTK